MGLGWQRRCWSPPFRSRPGPAPGTRPTGSRSAPGGSIRPSASRGATTAWRSSAAPDSSGDLILHFKPGLDYGLSSDSLTVDLTALGDYNLYTGIEAAGTRSLSYFGGDAALDVGINPKGQVGFDVGDHFAYTDRVTAIELGAGVRALDNTANVALPIRPGGGALEIKPGYSFAFERFISFLIPPTGVTSPDQLDYISHQPSLQAKWKFLPKTAVVLDVHADLRQYAVPSLNPGTNAFYSQAGLSGLITPKLALVITGGYGNSFIDATSGLANYSSFIGQAEVSYLPSQTGSFKVGVARTFQPVPQLGWYGDNRIYLGGRFLLGGRVIIEFKGGGDFVTYPTGRSDFVLTTDEAVTFQVTRWFDIAVGHELTYRATSGSTGGGGAGTAYDYTRNQVFGRLTVKY